MAQVNHYYPPGVGVGVNRKSTAVWINRIIERLHPWAAVRFYAIEENRIEFQAGPHLYNLDLERNQLTQNVAMDGGDPIFTPTANAARTLEELNGYRRDDSGNRTPPVRFDLPEKKPLRWASEYAEQRDGKQTDADRVAIIRDVQTAGEYRRFPLGPEPPGDWATLCRNADAKRSTQAKPAQSIGFTEFWPLAEVPHDQRVLLLLEHGGYNVGWYDSRDKRYRIIVVDRGRPDIAIGARPIGWLPLDYVVSK